MNRSNSNFDSLFDESTVFENTVVSRFFCDMDFVIQESATLDRALQVVTARVHPHLRHSDLGYFIEWEGTHSQRVMATLVKNQWKLMDLNGDEAVLSNESGVKVTVAQVEGKCRVTLHGKK